tara:strand:- start:45 stop:329 length:285 start_codon:yes stop_codon:yes gene_type:complete
MNHSTLDDGWTDEPAETLLRYVENLQTAAGDFDRACTDRKITPAALHLDRTALHAIEKEVSALNQAYTALEGYFKQRHFSNDAHDIARDIVEHA